MRVISNKALFDFAAIHLEADTPLQVWRKIVEAGSFNNFAELKRAFNATDKVGDFYVFDIGGNKYRLIAAIHYNRRKIFIRALLTHAEYNLGKWKRRK